jgi:hypothetical protein
MSDLVSGLLTKLSEVEALATAAGEVYNVRTRMWADVDVLRLLVAAYDADMGATLLGPFSRRGWDVEFLTPLRPALSGGSS